MRISHWTMIMVIVLIAIAAPFTFKTVISAKSAQLNTDYANYLITATQGSVASAFPYYDGRNIFARDTARGEAVDTFYETLRQCFNYTGTSYADQVFYYVPCVFLIDTDGFYIEYTIEHADADGNAAFSEITTPINKWARTYSSGSNGLAGSAYHVEYHLDDTVFVEYQNRVGHMTGISGNYETVYDKLGRPAELDVFSSHGKFSAERNEAVISILQDRMEYYINIHDESMNRLNNVRYEFTLPEIKGEDWARLIDQPTVVSFLQGIQMPYGTGYLNIYSFAGSELEHEHSYYVAEDGNGNKFYHREGCPALPPENTKKPYSMYNAAKDGAFPCPICVR